MAVKLEALKKTLLYEAEGPATEIHRDVALLRTLDKVAERTARRWYIATASSRCPCRSGPGSP